MADSSSIRRCLFRYHKAVASLMENLSQLIETGSEAPASPKVQEKVFESTTKLVSLIKLFEIKVFKFLKEINSDSSIQKFETISKSIVNELSVVVNSIKAGNTLSNVFAIDQGLHNLTNYMNSLSKICTEAAAQVEEERSDYTASPTGSESSMSLNLIKSMSPRETSNRISAEIILDAIIKISQRLVLSTNKTDFDDFISLVASLIRIADDTKLANSPGKFNGKIQLLKDELDKFKRCLRMREKNIEALFIDDDHLKTDLFIVSLCFACKQVVYDSI